MSINGPVGNNEDSKIGHNEGKLLLHTKSDLTTIPGHYQITQE